MLYIVPTPIGNLEDITLRALRTLREVDIILAEDTRTTGILLHKYEISTPLRAFHAHNEHGVTEGIVAQLAGGVRMALVSDAGTPGISDPGFLLIRACVAASVSVTCLPGATAFVPAVVSSGLPCDRFHYEGFLPHKKGRQTRLKYLATLQQTFILYESPHRLLRCLKELITHCGEHRPASVARELSKLHETLHRGSLAELANYFSDPAKIKGEIVLVVGGLNPKAQEEE
jgi:16S rRNA (cytidine1402-2'-O)-methyltransferase